MKLTKNIFLSIIFKRLQTKVFEDSQKLKYPNTISNFMYMHSPQQNTYISEESRRILDKIQTRSSNQHFKSSSDMKYQNHQENQNNIQKPKVADSIQFTPNTQNASRINIQSKTVINPQSYQINGGTSTQKQYLQVGKIDLDQILNQNKKLQSTSNYMTNLNTANQITIAQKDINKRQPQPPDRRSFQEQFTTVSSNANINTNSNIGQQNVQDKNQVNQINNSNNISSVKTIPSCTNFHRSGSNGLIQNSNLNSQGQYIFQNVNPQQIVYSQQTINLPSQQYNDLDKYKKQQQTKGSQSIQLPYQTSSKQQTNDQYQSYATQNTGNQHNTTNLNKEVSNLYYNSEQSYQSSQQRMPSDSNLSLPPTPQKQRVQIVKVGQNYPLQQNSQKSQNQNQSQKIQIQNNDYIQNPQYNHGAENGLQNLIQPYSSPTPLPNGRNVLPTHLFEKASQQLQQIEQKQISSLNNLNENNRNTQNNGPYLNIKNTVFSFIDQNQIGQKSGPNSQTASIHQTIPATPSSADNLCFAKDSSSNLNKHLQISQLPSQAPSNQSSYVNFKNDITPRSAHKSSNNKNQSIDDIIKNLKSRASIKSQTIAEKNFVSILQGGLFKNAINNNNNQSNVEHDHYQFNIGSDSNIDRKTDQNNTDRAQFSNINTAINLSNKNDLKPVVMRQNSEKLQYALTSSSNQKDSVQNNGKNIINYSGFGSPLKGNEEQQSNLNQSNIINQNNINLIQNSLQTQLPQQKNELLFLTDKITSVSVQADQALNKPYQLTPQQKNMFSSSNINNRIIPSTSFAVYHKDDKKINSPSSINQQINSLSNNVNSLNNQNLHYFDTKFTHDISSPYYYSNNQQSINHIASINLNSPSINPNNASLNPNNQTINTDNGINLLQNNYNEQKYSINPSVNEQSNISKGEFSERGNTWQYKGRDHSDSYSNSQNYPYSINNSHNYVSPSISSYLNSPNLQYSAAAARPSDLSSNSILSSMNFAGTTASGLTTSRMNINNPSTSVSQMSVVKQNSTVSNQGNIEQDLEKTQQQQDKVLYSQKDGSSADSQLGVIIKQEIETNYQKALEEIKPSEQVEKILIEMRRKNSSGLTQDTPKQQNGNIEESNNDNKQSINQQYQRNKMSQNSQTNLLYSIQNMNYDVKGLLQNNVSQNTSTVQSQYKQLLYRSNPTNNSNEYSSSNFSQQQNVVDKILQEMKHKDIKKQLHQAIQNNSQNYNNNSIQSLNQNINQQLNTLNFQEQNNHDLSNNYITSQSPQFIHTISNPNSFKVQGLDIQKSYSAIPYLPSSFENKNQYDPLEKYIESKNQYESDQTKQMKTNDDSIGSHESFIEEREQIQNYSTNSNIIPEALKQTKNLILNNTVVKDSYKIEEVNILKQPIGLTTILSQNKNEYLQHQIYHEKRNDFSDSSSQKIQEEQKENIIHTFSKDLSQQQAPNFEQLQKNNHQIIQSPSLGPSAMRQRVDTQFLQKEDEQKIQYGEKDYYFVKKLGKGKHSEVFLAQDKKTGFLFAVKQVHKGDIISMGMEEQFSNEIKIQMCINHPNIIRMYGFYENENYFYLLMEYAPGGEIYRYQKNLPDGCFSEMEASYYLMQLASALRYLHHKNIIHRDIKPENLLISNGIVKLADFGYSRICDLKSTRSTFCGTLDYLSPQVVKGLEYNHDVDVWAFGVMVYEFLQGIAPFYEQSQDDTLDKISQGNYQFVKPISEEARNFIKILLDQETKNRIAIRDVCRNPWILQNIEKYQNQKGPIDEDVLRSFFS